MQNTSRAARSVSCRERPSASPLLATYKLTHTTRAVAHPLAQDRSNRDEALVTPRHGSAAHASVCVMLPTRQSGQTGTRSWPRGWGVCVAESRHSLPRRIRRPVANSRRRRGTAWRCRALRRRQIRRAHPRWCPATAIRGIQQRGEVTPRAQLTRRPKRADERIAPCRRTIGHMTELCDWRRLDRHMCGKTGDRREAINAVIVRSETRWHLRSRCTCTASSEWSAQAEEVVVHAHMIDPEHALNASAICCAASPAAQCALSYWVNLSMRRPGGFRPRES